VGHKNSPLILDHNSHVSWWIFTLLVSVERGIIALQRSYKICVSTLPDKIQKNIKQHILKSVVTVSYYSTVRMSLRAK